MFNTLIWESKVYHNHYDRDCHNNISQEEIIIAIKFAQVLVKHTHTAITIASMMHDCIREHGSIINDVDRKYQHSTHTKKGSYSSDTLHPRRTQHSPLNLHEQ